MTCPVCSGAFSWKEDLVRHFGAVHRLEGLVDYMESEYPADCCPDKCRVPRSLFKDLIPIEKSIISDNGSVEVLSSASSSANTKLEGAAFETELLDLSATGKIPKENAGQRNGFDAMQLNNETMNEMESIQRFHCDACDFSANNRAELIEHMQFHHRAAAVSQSIESNRYASLSKDHRTKKHGSGLRYRCDLCPFATSKSQNLRRHANIHIRADSMHEGFRCGYCRFAHKQRRCIIFHLSRYHGDQPVRFSSLVDGEIVDVTTTVAQKPLQSGAKGKSVSQPAKSRDCSFQSVSMSVDRTSPVGASNVDDGLSFSPSALLEQQLPLSMIYSTPVKCPLCDFTNRVRINLIRHIRLYHGDGTAKLKSATLPSELKVGTSAF